MPYDKDEEKALYGEAELKKVAAELIESTAQLRDMRDYARDNHYVETAKHLNKVLEVVAKSRAGHASAVQLNEIKIAITKAKASMRIEKEQIFSSLRSSKSTFQPVFDNYTNFFSPRNKFEVLVDKLEKLGQKKPPASSRFFQLKSVVSHSFIVVAESAKKTFQKR